MIASNQQAFRPVSPPKYVYNLIRRVYTTEKLQLQVVEKLQLLERPTGPRLLARMEYTHNLLPGRRLGLGVRLCPHARIGLCGLIRRRRALLRPVDQDASD